ncbi:MAG TPA: AMP-binding protein [Pilimelia sp.]|nr:AMP-binding protein [Pilimelia sp.]
MPDSPFVQVCSSGNLADYVRRSAESGPDRPALRWQDAVITWGELNSRVDEMADRMTGLALPASDDHPARVAVALPNTPDFVVALFGILRAGLVAVPVNPGYTARELRHVLADSGAAALLGTPDVLATVDGIRSELPALREVYAGLPPPGERQAQAEEGAQGTAGGDDLAVLLYTSGTEGNPKGAMLPHRALIANHVQLAQIEPPLIRADDTMLLALPLFHAYGLNSGLGAVVFHGACGVLVERFDPADTLDLIARHHVTAVIGVPAMYVGWSLLPDLGELMASVRLAICGAAPLEPATAGRFTEATRHPVVVGYGLTETAPVVTSTLASPVHKIGSIGRPIPGVELILRGANGEELWRDGEPADDEDAELGFEAPGSPGTDPGEIVVRGENLFLGYWPDGREGPDTDGWWATGDIAYADEDGDLFIVDRLGELILVSGFNVYPHEVELVLDAHPSVAESAVLGVPHPFTGQTVKAYVVRAPDTAASAEEIMRHCERNLARFKCPTSIEFVPGLPHSPTGKVRKTALRARTVLLEAAPDE